MSLINPDQNNLRKRQEKGKFKSRFFKDSTGLVLITTPLIFTPLKDLV